MRPYNPLPNIQDASLDRELHDIALTISDIITEVEDVGTVVSAAIVETITDGDTTHASSSNALFDALALKADKSITINGSNLSSNVTVSDANLSFSDITTNNVSTSKHGFVPKAPNDANKFLDGTGSWTTVSLSTTLTGDVTGSGTGSFATTLATTALDGKTFTGTLTFPSTTSIGTVSSTEIGYLDGVTSAIQTQLNNKVDKTTTINGYDLSANRTLVTDDIAEDGSPVNLWFTDARAQAAVVTQVITNGVTTTSPSEDAVYDALALKAPLASPTFTGTVTISDGATLVFNATPNSDTVITVDSINISAAELSYLDGATSNIQTQLNELKKWKRHFMTMGG